MPADRGITVFVEHDLRADAAGRAVSRGDVQSGQVIALAQSVSTTNSADPGQARLSNLPGSDAQRSFGRPLTPTSSTNPCEPWKSSGLAVYKGSALLAAVAAIIRSAARFRG